jgi:hypothetical protein
MNGDGYLDIAAADASSHQIAVLINKQTGRFRKPRLTALPDEPSQWPNAADLTTIIGEEVESALIAGKTVELAIQDMNRRLTAAMARVRRR